MKIQSVLSALFILLLSMFMLGFNGKESDASAKQVEPIAFEYMQINALESVLSGGAGRSRMLVTDQMGRAIESADLNNYYSMVGINFNNIQANDAQVVAYLNILGKDGWEVVSTSSGGNDVYFTKYLLKRAK